MQCAYTQDEQNLIDLSDHDSLVFRVRGDGRKYIANIRTENWIVSGKSADIWQAFLFARWVVIMPISA